MVNGSFRFADGTAQKSDFLVDLSSLFSDGLFVSPDFFWTFSDGLYSVRIFPTFAVVVEKTPVGECDKLRHSRNGPKIPEIINSAPFCAIRGTAQKSGKNNHFGPFPERPKNPGKNKIRHLRHSRNGPKIRAALHTSGGTKMMMKFNCSYRNKNEYCPTKD